MRRGKPNPLQMAMTAKRNMIPVEGVQAEAVQRMMRPTAQTVNYAQWMGRKLYPDAMRVTNDSLSDTVIARSENAMTEASPLEANAVPVARGQMMRVSADYSDAKTDTGTSQGVFSSTDAGIDRQSQDVSYSDTQMPLVPDLSI